MPVRSAQAVVADAVVGEPEAAVRVEDEVVRGSQRLAVALGVEVGHLAGGEVDALDAAADVAVGIERPGEEQPAELDRVKQPPLLQR